MAANTGESSSRLVGSIDCFNDAAMAGATGLLRNRPVTRRDTKRLGKEACGEAKGVPEAIRRFGEVFRDEARWCVTIIAAGNKQRGGWR